MKKSFAIILGAFSVILTACQKEEPNIILETENTPEISQIPENPELPKETECGGRPLEEGWHCQNLEELLSYALPKSFKPYTEGDLFNFIDEEKKQFLHVAFYPLASFNEEAQKLLNENKVKEYLEYEQKNICDRLASCKSKFDSSSFSKVNLGEREFNRFEVNMETEPPFKVTHYTILMDGIYLDFSTSEGEEIAYPAESETKLNSVKIEDEMMESILNTIVSK